MKRYSSQPAFTLIELLVVVTIIVVLLALLTPALDRAIRAASSTVCLANLHTWGMGMQVYATDHKGARMTVGVSNTREDWWIRLGPYIGETDVARRTPLGVIKALLCPDGPMRPGQGAPVPGSVSTDLLGNKTYVSGGTVFWGSASQAWQYDTPGNPSAISGSYGWNYWTCDTPGWAYPPDKFFGRFRNMPGEAVLLGDAIWIGSWPQANNPGKDDVPPPNSEIGNGGGEGWVDGGELGRWVINRHPLRNQSGNFGFADGSALNIRLGELWNLRWHKTVERSLGYVEEYP